MTIADAAAPAEQPLEASASRFSRPPRWVLLLLLCAALVTRGRVMRSGSESLRDDPDSYRSVAWQIYRYHTIGLNFGQHGVGRAPTATRPPLYPLLLSLADFASEEAEPFGFGFIHVVLGVATVWAVWGLSNRIGLSWQASLLAAGLIAIDPLLLHQSTQLMTETLATFLAAATLWAVVVCSQERRMHWAVLAGVLLGLCVLSRPTFLLWAVCVVAALAWRATSEGRAKRAAVMAACAAAVLLPWGWRNLHYFGAPVITTTHGGSTLLLANNPLFYQYLRSAPWGSIWDARDFYRDWKPRRDAAVPARTVDGKALFDEVAIDRLAYRLAWENIRREPLMFGCACLVRVGRLWNVLPHQATGGESASRRGQRYAVALWYLLEFNLAAIGAWSLGRKLVQAPWIFGTLLVLSFTAAHTLYWTDMRMRAPLAVVVVLCAAQGVVTLASAKRSPKREPVTA